MPKPLEADRELVKLLWLQGLKIPQIAEQTGLKPGTIKTWAHRGNWAETRSKAKEVLGTVPKQVVAMEIAKDLQAQSKAIREQLSDELRDQVATLRDKPAKYKDLPGKYGRASTTLTIANTAAKVFGWSEQTGNSVINIGTLNQLKLESSESSENVVNPGDGSAQPIDI